MKLLSLTLVLAVFLIGCYGCVSDGPVVQNDTECYRLVDGKAVHCFEPKQLNEGDTK